mgnify:CR=1 FL=1
MGGATLYSKTSGERVAVGWDASRNAFGVRLRDTGATDYYSGSFTPSEGSWYHCLSLWDFSTNAATLYINGELQTGVVEAVVSSSSVSGEFIGGSTNLSAKLAGSLFGFSAFNTTLTATQAQEIYEQGISGWLAANPEYQWGETAPSTKGTFANISGSWDTFSGASSGGFTGVNTASDGRAKSSVSVAQVVGQVFRVDYDLTINSGGGIQFLLSSSGGGTSSNTVSVTATGVGSVTLTTSASDIATLRVNAIGNTDIVLTGVSVTKLGCLASLPMDEGIGYQLHDQSPNHFDALLSETGTSHLQPKREGFVRDFNLDAYTAPVDLVTSSQDIIDVDSIETSHVSDAVGTLTFARTTNNITVSSDNAADTDIMVRLNHEKIV